MLEQLTNVPGRIVALEGVGTVSKKDYELSFVPLVDEARRAGRRMRLLYLFGPRFERITLGGLWADARLGLRYLQVCDGFAVVSDGDLVRESTRRIGSWMPCPVRVFGTVEYDEALRWLNSLPTRGGVSHRGIVAAYVGGTSAAIGGFIARCRRARRPESTT